MTTTNLGEIFKDYEENDKLSLLDAADYELEVIACKARDTDLIPTWKVVSGPYAGKRCLLGVISFKGNAQGRFFRTMASLGLDEAFFRASPSLEEAAKALIGRVAVVSVKQEAYKEEMRNKLERIVQLVAVPQGSGVVAGVPQVVPVAAAPAPVPVAVAVAAPVPVAVAAPVAEALPVGIPGVPVVLPAPVAVVAAPVPAAVAAPVPVAVPVPVAAVAEVPAPAAVAVPAAVGTIPSDDEPGF